MSLEELDGESLREMVDTERRGIVVDFWSPWCAPCRALRPHLERLAKEHEADWRFVAVNTEAHPKAAEELGVSALPTLVWFRGGEELERLGSGVTLSSVAETLEKLRR